MAPTIPIEYTERRELNKCSDTGVSVTMGKTRKVSKGYSSGFVPDYRHAVETVAESEGFGSAVRVNTEMAALEDLYDPKRKCISLNVNDYDSFNVPIKVMSLSEMSQLERRDLEMKLKKELAQVKMLQTKIASMGSNAMRSSPPSDIHSYSEGLKRPIAVESYPMSINKMTAAPGKKKFPLGRNGPRTKGGVVEGRHTGSVKQGLPRNTNFVMMMKQCETLLNRLMAHQYGWVFNEPVDTVKLNIPDYFNVIKHPMDLGTIKKKLHSGGYSSPMGFAADVRLTFENALTYNPRGNDVHLMAETMKKFFEVRWKPIEKKIPIMADESQPSRSSVIIEAETASSMPATKKQKSISAENKVKQKSVKHAMSDVEKQRLGRELETLLAELPDNIIDFLKESSLNGNQVSEDEIEIDIDTLGDDTLFTLRRLLDEYLLEKQKNQATAVPCEMEIRNDSGLSNSSVEPCKDKEPAHEDEDIGGIDPPILSFPALETEDITERNRKCSSSSSSSSGSGSSSSDVRSFADGESDNVQGSVPGGTAKETLVSELNLEQKKDDMGGLDTGESLDGHAEQQSLSNFVSVEPNIPEEGESAPPERQVSPEKLYRAALLRSRFADIIIKAQENTLEKGEKQDPEKLRLEMEELERRRKEEKARLQAEAKAAEEARRKAEIEAAAEARRQRELEREAARQALLKMEKTVDINENSQFMEDLEMFRAAPDEHLQSLIEETSPEHSQNGLGSFKFQASSNPLEQLGLYMKMDDEEEEEGEPKSTPDAPNDPEEGEID
ncbi:transcription factor GTE10-like isoform X2 [Olea europaea var. sylvestris]|uniref:Transcription factor GTE10-like isoform X4 n=1 Tax=Olea europaea subsp. europaea TaxID=158383 RepID=A0A8S0SJM3_OLEEU|nr:transcription factor GTE10-like isoform X2 [Olea europaea var. sylvestris]CAA2992807.1 transcription factor GTE10-like isoform X4 [Olea europaea subsp. europaea]